MLLSMCFCLGSEDEVILEGWNCTFPSSPQDFPAITNTSTVSQLLQGYFDFYAMFDFHGQVICPRLAKSVDIASFRTNAAADEKISNFKVILLSLLWKKRYVTLT